MTVFSMLMQIGQGAPWLAQQSSGGGSGAGGPGGLLGNQMLIFPLLFVIMYFVLIRPQNQKRKEQENNQKSLQPGDEVVTIGGAHGVVTTVYEKTVVVRMVEGKIEFERSAIASRFGKNSGSEKDEEKK